jgi:hypothetical protein
MTKNTVNETERMVITRSYLINTFRSLEACELCKLA